VEATRVTAEEVKERMGRGEPFAFVDTRNPQAQGDAATNGIEAWEKAELPVEPK
jgi:hypothetical protein